MVCECFTKQFWRRTEGFGMTRETRQANKKLSFPPKGCILPLTKNPDGRMLCEEGGWGEGGAKRRLVSRCLPPAILCAHIFNDRERERDTLGTRGFSRVQREFSVLAEGRSKPETALEKSLAPRVRERETSGSHKGLSRHVAVGLA